MARARRRLDRQHHVDRRDQRRRRADDVPRRRRPRSSTSPGAIAVDLAEHGIRVNCVAPAHIPTDDQRDLRPGGDRAAHAAAAAHGIAAATSRTRRCSWPATGRRRSPGSCCPSTAARPPGRPMVKFEDVAGRRPTRRRSERSMDPATGIYSCDDHLDLSAVPPDALGVAAAARAAPSAARTSSTRDGKRGRGCARTA